jgi:hypothetical protein
VSLVLSYYDLLIVLAQVFSCIDFDITLDVIPSDLVASSCSLNFSKLYCVNLEAISLSGHQFIILAPNLLFCSVRSRLPGYI